MNCPDTGTCRCKSIRNEYHPRGYPCAACRSGTHCGQHGDGCHDRCENTVPAPSTIGSARRTGYHVTTWLWRHWPHRHRPWHPGNYELWYCRRCNWALCHQSWLPVDDRHRWVTFEPREREWPDGMPQDHWTGSFGTSYEGGTK